MKRTKGDPMDIGQAAHAQDTYWEYPEEIPGGEYQWSYVDALSKGKSGKGKGGGEGLYLRTRQAKILQL